MDLIVNDKTYQVGDDGKRMLVYILRNDLRLTGTRFGCGAGLCGACTVLLDGQPARSCMTPVEQAVGKRITTIEGLAVNGKLHPIQQAFIDEQAPQCGWCMSGQIMQAVGLLLRNPKPSEEQIIDAMEKNLCRCGTYARIKRAIQRAAR